MGLRIEDYALIGDTHTGALVGRDGSIDWLCLPTFDAPACFAALLGRPEHGRWAIAPRAGTVREVERRYRAGSLVLETLFTTPTGRVRIIDCMPPRQHSPRVVRIVEGVEGRVPMELELIVRFDYGSITPWGRKLPDGRFRAIGGPDSVTLQSPIATRGKDLTTVAEFEVCKGERLPFVLSYQPSHETVLPPIDPNQAVVDCEHLWRAWSSACRYEGPWRDAVIESLVTLRALTYTPTGAIIAAPTTSLPERLGGVRNWDYRFCWLRDATFVLEALLLCGFHDEARSWRDWLLRAVAGDPAKLQIMYSTSGARRLPEQELDWLPGYEGSKPVRIGNGAVHQLQLDVYGEVMDALEQAQAGGLPADPNAWQLQRTLLQYLESAWTEPDEGLWEVRGPRQQFTHSKVMCWVAFDRAIKAVEAHGMDGPVERWRALRTQIHAEVCQRAWNEEKRAFTQSYGSPHLDASALLIPQVGFLPIHDPRVVATVDAIERELLDDGFVMRYPTQGQDGLPGGEGVFLACSFWLADAYALLGRNDEAEALFERLLALRNDVGLLAEEYDPRLKRQLGNFPQAFSHVGLVNSAMNLTLNHEPKPALRRPARNGSSPTR